MCRINEMNVSRLKFGNVGWVHKILNNVHIRKRLFWGFETSFAR